MADDLRFRIDIDADVTGQQEVDGLRRSVDNLGDESRETGAEARQAGAGIDSMGAAARRTAQATTQANGQMAESFRDIGKQIDLLGKAWLTLAGGNALVGTAAELGRIADEFANLRARMQLVVGEGPALESALAGVQQVALATGVALTDTGNLFTRLAASGKELKLSNEATLALTETIAQAVKVSGASAEAAAAGIQQLIQGLQSGVLRGDEFNSVMENSPRLAKALADGLNLPIGKLRELAEAGSLTAATVINALQSQAQTIQKEFAQLPATIGTALTNLRSQFALYVAEVDASSGASAKAAAAIDAIGQNLDFLASALVNVGQAWLGWKAFNLAADWLALKTVVTASTAATIADTAATVTNTAAHAQAAVARRASMDAYLLRTPALAAETAALNANTAAQAANAASVSKMAAALSLIKGFSLAFVVTNLKDIGDWIARTAFSFTELSKANERQERESKRLEAATKAQAREMAELAAKKRLAAEAALGLTEKSKAVVAAFEAQTKSGDKAAESIGKLAKALDLSNVKGIADAGAALATLASKGALTAEQVRTAWQQALSTQDLRVFEVQAQAAFDGSAQGAERLAAAMQGVLGEAIRRAGEDADAVAIKALNNFDVLFERLDEIDAKGHDVGSVLAASLEQATAAAKSETAIQKVIARWEELGDLGLVTGDRLADGLDSAFRRLDDLSEGVGSVTEAFRTLGLKSPIELQRIADRARQAYEVIKNSGQASALQVQEAFRRAAQANIEASGGIVSSALRVEAAMRGLSITVDETGRVIIKSMGGGADETDRLGESVDRVTGKVRKLKDEADRPTRLEGSIKGSVGRRGDFSGEVDLRDTSGEPSVAQLQAAGLSNSEIQRYYEARSTPEGDKAAGLINRQVRTEQIDHEFVARQRGLTGPAVKAFVDVFGEMVNEEVAAFIRKMRGSTPVGPHYGQKAYYAAFERAEVRAEEEAKKIVARAADDRRREAAREARSTPTTSATTHRVEIVLGGKTVAVDTAGPDAAKALLDTLTSLNKRTTAG